MPDAAEDVTVARVWLDGQGSIVRGNAVLARLLACTQATLPGRRLAEFLTPASVLLFENHLLSQLRLSGRVDELTLQLRPSQGASLYVMCCAARLPGPQDEERYECAFMLANERMRAEAALLRIKRAAEHVPGALFQLQRSGDGRLHMPYVSGAAQAVFGLTPAVLEADAEALLSRVLEQDRPAMLQALHESAKRMKPWRAEFRVQDVEGQPAWCAVEARPQRAAEGAVLWHGYASDITARKALDAAQIERDAARRSSQAKSEFLANMSHEIRTPLNAIVGLGYLLEQSRLDASQHDMVAKLQVASRTLLDQLNDVLDLAKIEAQQVTLECQSFELDDVLQELRDLFAPQAQAKGLLLQIEPAPHAAQSLSGDMTRLRQMLANLLSNAVKFTRRGCVRLTLEAAPSGPDRVRLHAVVHDTGIGIEPDLLPHLFQPFVQADASTTRRYGGTGLGLSLVQRLARLMGGDAWAQSAPGVGSRFHVCMELEASPPGGEGKNALRVLIAGAPVERGAELQRLCRSLGWRVAAMSDTCGAGPLTSADVDIVLLDVPATAKAAPSDTAALAQHLARLPAREQPAVVIIGAHNGQAAVLGYPDLRPQGVLAWPISASALFNAVAAALSRQRGGVEGLPLGLPPVDRDSRALARVSVLVVDDSNINRDVAQRILALQGAAVSCCANGLEALEWLRSHPQGCDAVLMDVQMPVMDGLEATRRIRGELGMPQLPILALTAGALVSERERARAAGMDGFVTKPIEPQTLVRTLCGHVAPHRLARTRTDAPPPVERAEALPWPLVAGIDSPAVAQRLGRDLGLFRSLLSRLLEEYADLAQAPQAQQQFELDPERFRARMHRLRGSAGTLGATSLQENATALEAALLTATQGESDAVTPHIRELATSLQLLAQAGRAIFLQPPAAASHDGASAAPDCTQLNTFMAMLAEQDLQATELFRTLEPALQSWLPSAVHTILCQHMGTLRYQQALACLQAHPGLSLNRPGFGRPL